MLSSQVSIAETWGTGAPEEVLNVRTALAKVRRLDRWIFTRADTREVDFAATLARFASLFDCLVSAPAPTHRTLAKLLATALLIAIGQRSSPVWFEAAVVFRNFEHLCQCMCSDDRHERQFLRSFTAFHQSYMQCHMLALSDASHVLNYLQGRIEQCDENEHEGNVEQELRIYMNLPRPCAHASVMENWPGPRNVEWQDTSLMTWLYGGVYDRYAEAVYEIETANNVGKAAEALQQFTESVGFEQRPVMSVDEARWRLDEHMQHYADVINTMAGEKEAQGPTGSGSVLGCFGYVKERDLAANNIMMEYFVNIVCQFPTFDSSRYLPEVMHQLALAVLQLQVQLSALIEVSQLGDLAHELYARLESQELVPEQQPIDSWINNVAKLYHKFEDSCGPTFRALHTAVHGGRN